MLARFARKLTGEDILACGSFNNYAIKARNRDLHTGIRASALYSCIQQFRWTVGGHSYLGLIAQLGAYVGADPLRFADHDQLTEALEHLESVRKQVLEVIRAYDQERKRLKGTGRRVPSKAEKQALEKAITAALLNAGMLPFQPKDA